MDAAIFAVTVICRLWAVAIIIRAVLSWFNLRPDNPVVRFLDEITDPILTPIRRVLPAAGGLDFSPMVAWLVLWLVIPYLLSMFASTTT